MPAACTNLRYYTTYEYKHIRSETERVPLTEVEYLSGIFQESAGARGGTAGGWYLQVMELKRCEQRDVDVSEEVARITITSPTWFYFVAIGGLQAGLSTPFWVLGSRADKDKDARDNYLVGTLVFLIPGLAIASLGAYFRLVSGTEERKMGLRRRAKTVVAVACGERAAGGRSVTLGTRTGPIRLGKTDEKGRIPFPVGTVRPLARWEHGKLVKAYFEVFVEDTASQDVRLPKGFPVKESDLREPTLAPGPMSP